MSRFVSERKNNWQRLEDLLQIWDVSALQKLSKAEVREFGELYRRAAADLAIARSESRDPRLVNYLNNLVIRAHGRIYRAETRGANLAWNFFAKDFPQAFRQNIRYFALAAATFWIFALAGFALTWRDLDFSQFVYADVRREAQNNVQWWLGANDANQYASSRIMTNNIFVTFKAFATGAFFGIGSFYTLAFEGTRLGSVFAVCYKVNPSFGNALATFVVGHGVIELSCIIICGAAGMMIGYSIINPGNLTRVAALKKKGVEAAKIVLGCACLLIVAGTIEGFLSPSALPAAVKIGTGVLTGIAMYSYLFLVGREPENGNNLARNFS
ncbi:MAG: stage II sporulation protein M [Pyrinomonadaceae bacterium]